MRGAACYRRERSAASVPFSDTRKRPPGRPECAADQSASYSVGSAHHDKFDSTPSTNSKRGSLVSLSELLRPENTTPPERAAQNHARLVELVKSGPPGIPKKQQVLIQRQPLFPPASGASNAAENPPTNTNACSNYVSR